MLKRSDDALPPARVSVLTSFPGIEARPTFSPDGNQVAFSWDGETQDNADIYVVIVGSDSRLRVTTDPARDISPAWKPDGSQIAFARQERGRAVIYVASPLGQSEQKLAEFSVLPVEFVDGIDGAASAPSLDPLLSWSPDGRWLAVSRVTAASEQGIFLLAHDGSARRLLVSGAKSEDYGATAFSPDGTALAYVQSPRIHLVTIDATDPPAISKPPRRLTRDLGSINGLTWTAMARK